MQTFATFISKVINVFTSAAAAMLVAVAVQQIPASQKLLWLVISLISAAIPLGVYFFQYKKGGLSSFWSPQLGERLNAHAAWAAAAAIFSFIAFVFDAPNMVLALGLVFLSIGILNLLLSQSFKISVHGETITLFVLTAILAISVNYVALVILIILVGWSRVYLKAHTLLEVSSGVLAAVVATFAVFSLFGLATF